MDGHSYGKMMYDTMIGFAWLAGIATVLLLGSCSLNVYYFLAY